MSANGCQSAVNRSTVPPLGAHRSRRQLVGGDDQAKAAASSSRSSNRKRGAETLSAATIAPDDAPDRGGRSDEPRLELFPDDRESLGATSAMACLASERPRAIQLVGVRGRRRETRPAEVVPRGVELPTRPGACKVEGGDSERIVSTMPPWRTERWTLSPKATTSSRRIGRAAQEPGVCGACRQTEDPPTEAIGEGFGIALDIAMLVERLERPRELALVAVEELGQPHHTQAVATDIRDRRAGRAPRGLEPERSSRGSRLHSPRPTGKDATRFECRARFGNGDCRSRPTSVACVTISRPAERARRAPERADPLRHDDPYARGRAAGRGCAAEHARPPPPGTRRRCPGVGAGSRSIAGHPMVPEGFTFAGRPQLAACFRGTGGGGPFCSTATSTSSLPRRRTAGATIPSPESSRTASFTAVAPAT